MRLSDAQAQQVRFILASLANDIEEICIINFDTGDVNYIIGEAPINARPAPQNAAKDYITFIRAFAFERVYEPDRQMFLFSTSAEVIRNELSTKPSYYFRCRIVADSRVKFYTINFVHVKDSRPGFNTVFFISDINEMALHEKKQRDDIETSYRRTAMYQRAITMNALGTFECNLTQDRMIGEIMARVHDELIPVTDNMPHTDPFTYTAYSEFCNSVMPLQDGLSNDMNYKTSREYLLDCFNKGILMPEVTYWSNFGNAVPMYSRLIFFLSKDITSDDILAYGVTYDVTSEVEKDMEHKRQLEEARQKAERANDAKTAFLFNMSHDIRTPMNAIIGFTRMARNRIGNDEQVVECLDKVELSGQHLLGIINDILDMARIENGKAEINEQIINLTKSCSTIGDIVGANIHEKGLVFNISLEGIKNNYVYADAVKINQILLNIVSNSIKYTNAGGTINCKIEQTDVNDATFAIYNIIISDTGIGMSKDYLDTIFEPFSREKTSTISRVQGTGLGMAISKQLTELMGGTIAVTSSQGHGTTVKVSLPLRFANPSKDDIIRSNITTVISAGNRRILLVEDNELNREIAVDMLTSASFRVDEADNGKQAVTLFSSHPEGYYELILMDIQMPVMDGYEATRQIRMIEKNSNHQTCIPIIAMTANVFEEDVQNALSAGMNAHIGKPIDPKEFWSTVSDYTHAILNSDEKE